MNILENILENDVIYRDIQDSKSLLKNIYTGCVLEGVLEEGKVYDKIESDILRSIKYEYEDRDVSSFDFKKVYEDVFTCVVEEKDPYIVVDDIDSNILYVLCSLLLHKDCEDFLIFRELLNQVSPELNEGTIYEIEKGYDLLTTRVKEYIDLKFAKDILGEGGDMVRRCISDYFRISIFILDSDDMRLLYYTNTEYDDMLILVIDDDLNYKILQYEGSEDIGLILKGEILRKNMDISYF